MTIKKNIKFFLIKMNIDKYSKGFADPFFLSIAIVVVLNIMVFFFFHPAVSRKAYFRGIFYMWIVTMAMVYLHHRAVDGDYRAEMEKNLNIDLVAGKGTSGAGEEIEPHIDVFEKKSDGGDDEDELI